MKHCVHSDPDREAALFQAALQRSGQDRASFLEGACQGDPDLRQRMEALLAAHEETEGALGEVVPTAKEAATVELTDMPDEAVGQTLGRYKLLEKVGEGGCGVVYVAEQTEPVRRRVALKVIKLGMDTKQVVARFESERQALAMMDHPNIAKVLDAGTTDTGRPYFIMELVRGIKITDYCDQNNLPTKARLDLFIKVCQAIQHAHQKGIIHRDIKPSNILVTLHDGVPVPKVIDFGIAKATEGRLTDATVYTQLHQFIGTPAYMSPEQAEMSGLDIDTRSDIYSLGVLLYELLTGKTPFDARELMAQGIDAMRKTIREQDPVRPSTRLATLQGQELTTTAKRRSVDTSKLLYQLKGDLDWIVMKCLEKDRIRRYETANGLVMDLKRHLNNEPVVARPPSQLYRFQKLVRRNKAAAVAAACILVALVTGLGVATTALVRERQARQRELAQSVRADAVAGFFDSLMLETLPSLLRQGNVRGARELMGRADRLASSFLSNAPAAELHLRIQLVRAFKEKLLDVSAAAQQAEVIARLLPRVTDNQLKEPRDLLRIEIAVARLTAAEQVAKQDEANKALDNLYSEFMGRTPPAVSSAAYCRHCQSLWLRHCSRKPAEAEVAAAKAYELISGMPASDAWVEKCRYEVEANYVGVLSELGEFELAERVAREGLGKPLDTRPKIRSAQLDLTAALSDGLCRQGHFAQATALLQKQRQILAAGIGSQEELVRMDALRGEVLARSGNGQAALSILETVAANRFSDPDNWRLAAVVAAGINDHESHRRLSRIASLRFVSTADGKAAAGIAWGLNQLPTDEATLAVTDAMMERIAQSSDVVTTAFVDLIGAVLAYREQHYDQALMLLDRFHSRQSRLEYYVDLPGQRASSRFLKAMIYAQLGRADEARRQYARAEEFLKKTFGDPPKRDRGIDWDRSYQAEARQREAAALFKAKGISLPDPDPK